METFRTMGDELPVADPELVSARVDGQQQLLDYVRQPIAGVAVLNTDAQEQMLSSVYKPMVATAKEWTNRQQEGLSVVTGVLRNDLGTQVATNGANLYGVVAALPADERERLLRVDPYTATGEPGDTATTNTPTEPSYTTTFGYDAPGPTVTYPSAGTIEPFTTIGPTSTTPTPIPSPGPTPVPTPGPTPPTTSTSGGCPEPCVTVNVNCPTPPKPEPEKEEPAKRDGGLVAGAFAAHGVARPRKVGVWDTAAPGLCRTADEYVTAFGRIGREVRTTMNDALTVGADIFAFAQKLKPLGLLGIGFDAAVPILKTMESVLREMVKMTTEWGDMFGGVNGDALVGLYFCRGFVLSLNNAKLGINLVMTAEINIDLVPSQTLKILDYLISYLHPVDVPALGMVDTLYLNDEITFDEAVCLSKLNGRQRNETDRQIRTQRQKLTPDLEVRYWQRRRTVPGDLMDRLRQYGMLDPDDMKKLIEMAALLPPPSDAIRFALRDVFDPQKLGLAEMKAEFQQQVGLVEMMAASGIEKTEITTAAGKKMELDLPLLYFISSYEECSPTQVYKMLHRLRPNRVNRYPLPKPGGGVVLPAPVDISTVRSLLKEKDYNPIWRDRLAAISFRPIGNTDIKGMYRRGVFGPVRGVKGFDRTDPAKPKPVAPTEIELRERYLDFGYAEEDANAKALLTATQFDEADGAKKRNKAMARICKAYKVGGFSYDQALAQLQNADVERREAIDFLGGCDLDMRINDLSLAVAGVKKQYVNAVVSEQQARDLLRGYGVAQARIDTHITTWNLYRTNKQRELTAQQVMQFWEEGIVPLADARARLVNLGYDATAANMMLNHVRVGQAAKGQKEATRVARLRETEQRRLMSAAQKEQKEREQAQTRRMTRFLALQTEKNLAAWWKAGEITRGEVEAVLTAKGHNPEDIGRWVRTNDPERKGKTDE